MKILHVLDHSIPLHSGYTFRTRAILQQQHQLGWETCHVTSPKHGNEAQSEEAVDGLTFYRTRPPSGLMSRLPVINQLALVPAMRERILDVIECEKPDIIHAHSPALNGLAALQAGRKSGLPVVYEIRAFWEDAAVDHGTTREGSLRYRLTRGLESYVTKHANALTTICEGLKNDLLERGIAEDKITTIPNAVSIERFNLITNKDAELERQLGLQGKRVLGFIGSFYAYEGLDLVVEAMPKILKAIPDAHFLLVGGGPQEANLKSRIRDLQLEQQVTMPGRVPHSEVDRYYSLVDLLVYPRKSMRLTELVTPLKPLEAMAQGKPVLASDVGGHRELIRPGYNGWLCSSNNVDSLVEHTVEILNAPQSWPKVIQQGREFVENIRNWKQSVENYRPLYERLSHGQC